MVVSMSPPASPVEPWWAAEARLLLDPENLEDSGLGALWKRTTRFRFVRENVQPKLLELDCQARPLLAGLWARLAESEGRVENALEARRDKVARQLRSGELGPEQFRATWQDLGFDGTQDPASPAADDYLEGLFDVSRLTVGEDRPAFGQVNMASRAERIADFLSVSNPGSADTVYDLGSGNGKVAVTVAASSLACVKGVEYGQSYVDASRRSAERLGVRNAWFQCADVRDVDLSDGTVFYLFHPFWGEVARTVAQTLAGLAQTRALLVYVQGPEYGFAEHFLAQVGKGAFESERRGKGTDTLVLRSH